jgi:hypothetical protein
MSKKLCISLAPLVAIAAFVVMPVAAQAASPHFYRGGISLKAGQVVPTLAWGTLTLTPLAPSKQLPTSCENAAGANAENPGGPAGAPGRGKTFQFTSWNCTNAACPPSEIEFPPGSSKKISKEFIVFPGTSVLTKEVKTEGGYAGESLPWSTELIEATSPTDNIRLAASGVVVDLACIASHTVESGGPLGGDTDKDAPQFLAQPTVCFTLPGVGKQEPYTKRPENKATIPGELIFDEVLGAGAGDLECSGPKGPTESETISFKGATSGPLKVMGYEKLEFIESKIP